MNVLPTLLSPAHLKRNAAGATLAVIGFIVVISIIFGGVLARSMSTYRQVSHIASWQEALLGAEAGSDLAMAELRKTLFDPASAFTGWTSTGADGTTLPHDGKRLAVAKLIHGGEGNTELNTTVTIDAPVALRDGSERQWYRVRSTGTAFLPGAASITMDKRDHPLRRLSFRRDPKTNQDVTRPQSSRLVELLVKPTSFENAITSDNPIYLNNYKIVVDSYDSRDPSKSNGGLYDSSKRLKNGDIATNSRLIDAGDAHIYGDAFTNAGVIEDGANITGEQRNDFYQELIPIKKPNWPGPAGQFPIEATPTIVSATTVLTGGTKANPKRFKISSLTLSGSEKLTIAPGAGLVESYTEIWLTGDLKTTGSGTITVAPGANVKIFIEGNIDVKGNGTFNANSQPGRLQILGVAPPAGSTRVMDLNGNGVLVAAIYAPGHNVSYGGGGSSGTFWGSLNAREITMGGNSVIHYDEALADTGHVTDFRIKSWFEDVR